MNKFFNDILTGIDNKTFDIGRVGIAAGLLIFLFLEITKVFMTHEFNGVSFAGGLSAILAIGSGALALKSKTEPRGDSTNGISDKS